MQIPDTAPGLFDRLRAWWDGEDADPVWRDQQPVEVFTPKNRPPEMSENDEAALAAGYTPMPAPEFPSVADLDDRWPEWRLEMAEKLWGDQCLFPGGLEYAKEFVKTFAPSSEKSFLDLGAGIGGAVRGIHKEFGVWMTGMEPSESLAEIGKEQSVKQGLGRRAPVAWYDPENIRLDARKFNGVIAFETFFRFADKGAVLDACHLTLRHGGHLMFTDLVLAHPGDPGESVRKWMTTEKLVNPLWTAKQTHAAMAEREFDVRIAEDISDKYRSMVLSGWVRLLDSLTPGQVDKTFAMHMIRECEYWMSRMSALESGALRVYRFHAMKPSPEVM
jgi:SAM-dependent methyltransferase